jgi:hypothetical protein
MRAEDLEKAQQEALKSTHQIDVYHRDVIGQITESLTPLKNLLNICTGV